jgi:hypothetical protein
MISGLNNLSSLRLAIIAETKVFLRGLNSGASEAQLQAIIRRIQEKEHELLQLEGAVINPEMWRILYNRLQKRNLEFVDPES